MPMPRLAATCLFFGAPLIVVLGGLAVFGWLPAKVAAIATVLALIGVAAVALVQLGDLRKVRQYAGRLAGEDKPPAPRPLSALGQEMLQAVERVRLEMAAERQRLAGHAATGDAILDSLPDPLLLLDRDRRVVRANDAATAVFGVAVAGRHLAAVIRHPAVLEAAEAVLSGDALSRQVEFSLPVPVARDFSIRAVALPRRTADGASVLLALQDVTATRRAEQMRADFVANASHELRTPLATLIGFIETLQGPAREDVQARERFLSIMQEQAQRMARLVRDLLSLSQIELNEHTAPNGRVEVREVVESVADMLQFQAAAKEMAIEIKAPDGLPFVLGDYDQLMQVFQNLMDNAVKYGHRGTAVEVSLQAEPVAAGSRGGGASLVVSVRDRGEGIPREHLPRLTERFYRVDSARSRQLGGTGLGLAIVKHIVNRHRGSLVIESVVGQGSTFTVFLPAEELRPGPGLASGRPAGSDGNP